MAELRHPAILNLRTRAEMMIKHNPFTKSRKIPSVRIVNGKVNNTNTGRIIKLTKARTRAVIIAVKKSSTMKSFVILPTK